MIEWRSEQRKLSELSPWPRNPRQIDDKHAKRLTESVAEFGQVETLAIGPENQVYNGHQRIKTLLAEYGPDYVVDVRVAGRALTEKEREKLTIYLHHSATGAWDFAELAEWDADDLEDWGFDLETRVPDFAPVGADEQPRLDQKSPITCPHCQMEFVPK